LALLVAAVYEHNDQGGIVKRSCSNPRLWSTAI